MTKHDTHHLRNGMIATLVATAIISLITYVIPNGWKSVFLFIGSVLKWLLLITETPNWLLIIFAFIAFVLITGLFFKIYLFRKTNNPPYRLTELTVFGILWRWQPSHDGSIHGLVSFCPKCDFQIYARSRNPSVLGYPPRSVYHCEDCKRDVAEFNLSESEVENRVARKIQQYLRSKSRENNDNVIT